MAHRLEEHDPDRGDDELRLELYHPPYLFKGPRPFIQATPHEWVYGGEVAIHTPQALDIKWAHLVRSYFKMDGHHIQFNVVTAHTLRQAQADPEHHRDLIVRVAGYSDYFCDLSKELQEEIIARTEHQGL